MPETKFTNRLIYETSPYLLQHAHNPVDWFPWGDDAFQKAKAENKPVLLSCGYSACHWCHVMERESFEDPEIAALMNKYFVNIKVDREERPDIDQLYQQAVAVITVRGGWPLTVFMDHQGRPFFGGTYFPPTASYGRTAFPELLEAVHQKWLSEQERIAEAGQELVEYLRAEPGSSPETGIPGPELPLRAIGELGGEVDRQNGGFGRAPKFPNTPVLGFFLRVGTAAGQKEAVDLALFSLRRMARGGIYDQLGGGFHRYATDAIWLVPHFEKMLYDNAQLLQIYTNAFQITQEAEFGEVVRDTAAYIRREMTAPEGGFYATQDADSPEGEGRFFLWSIAEVQKILDPETAKLFINHFRMTEAGNFEGLNILNRLNETANPSKEWEYNRKLQQARAALLAVRETRPRPFRDEKIITSWNGLMIGALAVVYQVFGNPADYRAAQKAAGFILDKMRPAAGRLVRVYKDGQAKGAAFLDDYAFLVRGLLNLYETDFRPLWLAESLELTKTVLRKFGDGSGKYYLTADEPGLIARPLSGADQAIPGGVAVHCENLLRLAEFTGKTELRDAAAEILTSYGESAKRNVWGYASLIRALDMYHRSFKEFVFVSETPALPEILVKLRKLYLPYRILARQVQNDGDSSETQADHPARDLFTGRTPVNGKPTCYICHDQHCLPPVTEWEDLCGILEQLQHQENRQ